MGKFLCLFYFSLGVLIAPALTVEASVVPEYHAPSLPVIPSSKPEMAEAEFNKLLGTIEQTHQVFFRSQNQILTIESDWQEGIANAFADRDGENFIIEVYGGLARHPLISADAFVLLVCHELGHHLGGAPTGLNQGWPSLEGQADYFAALKCAKRVLPRTMPPDADSGLVSKCAKAHSLAAEKNLCVRVGMAGLSAARFFHSIEKKGPSPSFITPDLTEVSKTSTVHAKSQCRLDTFVAGALCSTDLNKNPGVFTPQESTCWQGREPIGYRPRCWYKP